MALSRPASGDGIVLTQHADELLALRATRIERDVQTKFKVQDIAHAEVEAIDGSDPGFLGMARILQTTVTAQLEEKGIGTIVPGRLRKVPNKAGTGSYWKLVTTDEDFALAADWYANEQKCGPAGRWYEDPGTGNGDGSNSSNGSAGSKDDDQPPF